MSEDMSAEARAEIPHACHGRSSSNEPSFAMSRGRAIAEDLRRKASEESAFYLMRGEEGLTYVSVIGGRINLSVVDGIEDDIVQMFPWADASDTIEAKETLQLLAYTLGSKELDILRRNVTFEEFRRLMDGELLA